MHVCDQRLIGAVTSLAWNPNGIMEFVTGAEDESVCTWRIIPGDGEGTRVDLVWGSINSRLVCSRAKIADAIGLEPIQRNLLEQRGALVGLQTDYNNQSCHRSPVQQPRHLCTPSCFLPQGPLREFKPRGSPALATLK